MANLAAVGNSKGTSYILPKYYNKNSEDCNCEENEYKLSHVGRRKKLFSKKSEWTRCVSSVCLGKLLWTCSLTCIVNLTFMDIEFYQQIYYVFNCETLYLRVDNQIGKISLSVGRWVFRSNRVLRLCLSKLEMQCTQGGKYHIITQARKREQCFAANGPVFSRYRNAWSHYCSDLFLIRCVCFVAEAACF